MIGDAFQPRRRLRAAQLNDLARSADSAHLGAAGYLSQENGLEQVARSPRRPGAAVVRKSASPASDGALIGIVHQGTRESTSSSEYEDEVNANGMTVDLYPNWPQTTGSRTARLYTPCVYRRAPLMVGDPVLCHPCSIAVTAEGEDY